MDKTKQTKKQNHVIEHDENGALVLFEMPHAALWYGYACVRMKDQDNIDDCMDQLFELHYSQNEN